MHILGITKTWKRFILQHEYIIFTPNKDESLCEKPKEG